MIEKDEQLILRCAKGDTAALEELVARYRDALMGFICSMVRDYQAAEEIVQDAFLRVYAKADRFKKGKKFKTWLYTIAANRARDELRKVKRRHALPLDAPLRRDKQEEGGTHADMLKSRGPSPDDLAADLDPAGERPLDDELEGQLRLNGLTYQEIAGVLGIPAGTVRSRLHYALEHLRRGMENYLEENDGNKRS